MDVAVSSEHSKIVFDSEEGSIYFCPFSYAVVCVGGGVDVVYVRERDP